MAEIIDGADNVDRVDERIGEMLAGLQGDDQLTSLITLPGAKADLAGQLMVHVHEAERVKLRRFQTLETAFLRMPWPEAIAAFRERGIVDPEELSTLLAQYRERGNAATRLMLETIQRQVRASLEDALQEGRTFRDFATDVENITSDLNLPGPSTNYTEMVFRTNIQTAYGAGRSRAMSHPDVVAARPLWEYRTVGDGRVRASHEMLRGLIFESGNPDTDILRPPGGFNCRCSAVTRSRDEIGGKRVFSQVPAGAAPDEGFRSDPQTLITGAI